MSYSTDRAALLAGALQRMAGLHAYQLVGHRENLEFWIAESTGALGALDGYASRLAATRSAHRAFVSENGTTVVPICGICGGPCELGPRAPELPRRIPDEALESARRELREAARAFLLALHGAELLGREEAIRAAGRLGTGFEPYEFERDDAP